MAQIGAGGFGKEIVPGFHNIEDDSVGSVGIDAVPNKALTWCDPGACPSALASPGLGAQGGRVVFSS